MSEDRPLTEFGDDEGDSEDTESDSGDDDSATTTVDDGSTTTVDDEPTTEAVDPAHVTYRWQPEGAACARCDATTERQWQDDGDFVCSDCKTW